MSIDIPWPLTHDIKSRKVEGKDNVNRRSTGSLSYEKLSQLIGIALQQRLLLLERSLAKPVGHNLPLATVVGVG